jgi:predicted TIM-barrel fold metal-dependent hydrolase
VIVDAHVHLTPPRIAAEWRDIAENEPYFALLAGSKVHKWGTAEELVARMDEEGVDEAWTFGFAFRSMELCRECNDYVLDAAKRFPGRIRPLAVVPPLDPAVESEILRCRDAGCIGVGELFPQGQEWDITDLRQTWRLAGLCDEAGLFLLLHTAEPVGHDYPGKGNVGPREAAAFCTNHPEVRVVLAHWGGGLWLYECMPEMRLVLANAWYDLAASPFLYAPEMLRAASAAGVGHKLLYGSDFPILSRRRYDRFFDEAALDDGFVRAVLGGNAEKLRLGRHA